MSIKQRSDDFALRRKKLQELSDEALHAVFWDLANQIIAPLVAEARTHTTPSIERSVLLRMGFSSVEAKDLVSQLNARKLLGHGAGRIVLALANQQKISVRDAGNALIAGQYWDEIEMRYR